MLTIQFKETLETFELPFTRLRSRAMQVEYIKATALELQYIQQVFHVANTYTIPVTNGSIGMWCGSIAQTIVANL